MTDLVSRLLEAIGETEREAPWTHHKSCASLPVEDDPVTYDCDCGVPASVLRRCAADRKLLELHRPVVIPPSGSPGTPYATSGSVGCAVCCDGEPVDDYEPRGWLDHPCDTIKVLAEAYGLEVTE